MKIIGQRASFINGIHFNLFNLNSSYERQVHDVHIAAFYMDPQNVGIHIDDYNERRILNFFSQIATTRAEQEQLHIQFNLYNKALAPFTRPTLRSARAPCWEYIDDPRRFWISAVHRAEALSKLGNRLFQAPGNSVPSERSFSIQNYIHSKSRNRLGTARVDKLIYIYMNSRALAGMKSMNPLSSLTVEQEVELEDELLQEEDDEEYNQEYEDYE